MNNLVLLLLENLFFGIGVPTLLVLFLSLLSHRNKELISEDFGFMAQYYVGSFGVITHEISHALMALIFGQKITAFHPLINLKTHPDTDRLGYVSREWNSNSWYQNLGNLFIGIAPIFGCTVILYLILRFTMPNMYNLIMSLQDKPASIGGYDFKLLVLNAHLFSNTSILSLILSIIGFLLIVSIVIGGFDLSTEDLLSTKSAFIGFCIIILCICLIATFLNLDISLNIWLFSFINTIGSLLSISILTGLFIYFLLRIYSFIFVRP